MCRKALVAAAVLGIAALYGCEPSQKQPMRTTIIPSEKQAEEPPADPEPTYDYEHKIRKGDLNEPTIGEGRVLKWRVAVARFGDLKRPWASPFDPPHTVTRRGDDVIVKSLDTEPCPAFTGLLIQKLMDSKRFIVVERKEINKILLEQEFGQGGRVLPLTAARLKKVRGINLAVTGEVSNVTAAGRKGTRTMALIRVHDVETAEILASARIQSKTVTEAVDAATQQLIDSIKDRRWTSKISAVRAGKIFLNAGEVDGVFKGDRFKVISLGLEILDPDEGTVLGREKTDAGVIEITKVEEKYSEARVLKSLAVFCVGDLAELIPGPYSPHDLD